MNGTSPNPCPIAERSFCSLLAFKLLQACYLDFYYTSRYLAAETGSIAFELATLVASRSGTQANIWCTYSYELMIRGNCFREPVFFSSAFLMMTIASNGALYSFVLDLGIVNLKNINFHRILTNVLGMRKIGAKMVPINQILQDHNLSPSNLNQWVCGK